MKAWSKQLIARKLKCHHGDMILDILFCYHLDWPNGNTHIRRFDSVTGKVPLQLKDYFDCLWREIPFGSQNKPHPYMTYAVECGINLKQTKIGRMFEDVGQV